MQPIPESLLDRPFTVDQAESVGVTRRMLRSSRFVSIFRGVYRSSTTTVDLGLLLTAAHLVLPVDAAASHFTSLRVLGFELGSILPLHFSTNSSSYSERGGIRIHRRQGELNATEHDGQRILGPLRTFVDVAGRTSERTLVSVGDWMMTRGLIELDDLHAYVLDSHLDGVQRARRAAHMVRRGSASPRESEVRWELVRAGLPEPELNADIYDDDGSWLARGDLVYRKWRVVVEYDGRQHELDPAQRQWDHLRREQLDAAGWRLIVITSADMSCPQAFVVRVRQALRRRGCPC